MSEGDPYSAPIKELEVSRERVVTLPRVVIVTQAAVTSFLTMCLWLGGGDLHSSRLEWLHMPMIPALFSLYILSPLYLVAIYVCEPGRGRLYFVVADGLLLLMQWGVTAHGFSSY